MKFAIYVYRDAYYKFIISQPRKEDAHILRGLNVLFLLYFNLIACRDETKNVESFEISVEHKRIPKVR